MEGVYLNKEKVDFEGPPPSSIQEIYSLLSNHLASQECALTAFVVDGIDLLTQNDSQELPASYKFINATSAPYKTAILENLENTLQSCKSTVEELNTFAVSALVAPWENIEAELDGVSERLLPLTTFSEGLLQIEPLQTSDWCSALKETLEKLEPAIVRYVDSRERKDVATLSDVCANTFAPCAANLLETLSGEVKPALAS